MSRGRGAPPGAGRSGWRRLAAPPAAALLAAMLSWTLTAGPASAAAAGAAADACQGRHGGTLTIASTQVPQHLNPAVQSGAATALAGAQIFASPLRFDADWQPQPYLAESVKVSADGRRVTIRLRRDARFHDGRPVTSDDIRFSIETIRENHPFKSMLEPVERVETPDARTAVLVLSRPHPAIRLAMSPALMPILPRHVYGDGQDPKTHPANLQAVGAGPFRLVEFVPSDRIVLERNPDYFLDGQPCLDRIVIRIVRDGAAAVQALERGEAQMLAFAANVRDLQRLARDERLAVTERGYEAVGALNWLAFNTARAPLDNRDVRKAIAHAIDREVILANLMQGAAAAATGPIAPGSPFYTADVEPYRYDPEKANALLDAAGFPRNADGIRFSLAIDYIPGFEEQQKNVAEYLQAALREVGIDLTVRASPDFPSWAKRVAGGEFDLTLDIVFNWGDPVIGVHRTYLSDNIRPQVWTNTQGYANPKVDDLLARAAAEADPEARKRLYREFQQVVVDDVPIYFINVLPNRTVYDRRVGNVPETVWGVLSPLDEVYLGP